jgi:predicted metal-dependent hydrolase
VSRASARKKFVPGGEQLFQRIYTRLGCAGRPPQFVVEYHPYADLTHTIRLRDDVAHVRLSDALGRASRTVIEAAAAILLGRLYRRRPPSELIEIYAKFTHAPSTRRRLRSMRRSRGRRLEHSPAGAHHDLAPLFARLNREYFGRALGEPRLGWSKRSWRAQLGCFDPALNQIVINRQLDHPRVPEYVVAYVLYHEMLHQKHPMRYVRCRRESHPVRFRNEEKQFTDYARAKRFLAKFPGNKNL